MRISKPNPALWSAFFLVFFSTAAMAGQAAPSGPRSALKKPAPRQAVKPAAAARAPQKPDSGVSRFHWIRMELSAVQVRQADGYSGSVQLGWAPGFAVSSSLLVAVTLGGTLLKGAGQDLVPVADVALVPDFTFARVFEVAAGGGAQFWVGHGGLAPLARGSFGWKPAGGNHRFLERVYLGYSRTFAVVPSNQFQLGVGFRLL